MVAGEGPQSICDKRGSKCQISPSSSYLGQGSEPACPVVSFALSQPSLHGREIFAAIINRAGIGRQGFCSLCLYWSWRWEFWERGKSLTNGWGPILGILRYHLFSHGIFFPSTLDQPNPLEYWTPVPTPVLFLQPVPVADTILITLWLAGLQLFEKGEEVLSLAWTLAVLSLTG